MFKKQQIANPDRTTIDEAIELALTQLVRLDVESEDYKNGAESIKALMENRDKMVNKPSISPEAILAALVNILGITLVLQHENLHIIATKAFGMISKVRF